jgi:hypothetical protein
LDLSDAGPLAVQAVRSTEELGDQDGPDPSARIEVTIYFSLGR